MSLDDVLEVAAEEPARVGVFSDLDGTLSAIVDDPEAVVPFAGAADALSRLAGRVGTVAIVSGRPVSFLERFFEPSIELSGLYGLEHRAAGRLLVDTTALEWFPVMASAAADARSAFGDKAVEDKTYSITVHYRTESEEFGQRVLEWADRTAEALGLDCRTAKMSVELHPPTDRSKGDAVEELCVGLQAAVYFGDDVGDRPAFERLRDLHAAGRLDAYAVVLVKSHETVDDLEPLATEVVNLPTEILPMLEAILEAAQRHDRN